jgi:hypothetical protein
MVDFELSLLLFCGCIDCAIAGILQLTQEANQGRGASRKEGKRTKLGAFA